MNENPEPLLLTLNQVAVLLSCTRRTVERLIAADSLRSVHLGRAVRVARCDLDAYIDRLRDDSA